MTAPQPAMMLPRELIHDSVALRHKPSAKIHYTFASQMGYHSNSRRLIVFLNGLMADKSHWLSVMAGIIRMRSDTGYPSLLAYDRYGQGMTEDRDPQDQGRERGRGHNVADAVRDLHQLITQQDKSQYINGSGRLRIVFVANSIGCAIARLYAQQYPGSVEALLLLDSIMANSNFDWWPNPDSSDFDPSRLPEDVTSEIVREQRAKFATIFAPDVVNKEGLDRRDLADLLPFSNEPQLEGPDGRGPWLIVVGHDPDRFASESLQVR
ncbi:MAG: hypothetical protein Q9222_007534 [Ikaeria aurantiellina]